MSFWSWLKNVCTPHGFVGDASDRDGDIAAGAMIGGVVGGAPKGLAVGVAASVSDHDEKESSSENRQGAQF